MDELQYESDDGTFSVSHRKALRHHMPASHWHSTYEIFYLISGKREFFIKDRTIVVSEGDVVVIAPHILHRTTNTEMPAHERLIINMDEGMLSSVYGSGNDIVTPLFQPLLDKEYMIITSSVQDRIVLDELTKRMLHEMEDHQPGFDLYARTLALQLLLICCRRVWRSGLDPLPAPSPMHETILEIVRYINGHYAEELTLHVLAEKFFVSPYYLSRFFKEVTGYTFVEYVNSVRVKEAIKLLQASSLKVGLIAKKAGFSSVTHFGRVFKSVTGHVPLYYRKTNLLKRP
ncbi:helix-turn-helix transcriptional regulator [Paenibacillus protaetiae]|uniref:AraC family transcriptional regulator n=1 Tax=Paenibacillus protaetiae TaxID=2509456 RepID=A0A4P6F5U8_9BACL|nr:AraC family transcriptional regulator [Paenibacillus protaetiae]QAY65768.1 AraC family transcriptional regulator [Paenibacillus protaetiae]